jgi:hypothetical protein
MGVGAAEPERAHRGAPRRAVLIRLPGLERGIDEEGARREVDLRIGPLEVQARRDLSPLERQRRLDEAGDPGRRSEVADVGLDRAEGARSRLLRLPEGAPEGRYLDGVAERRAGAVALDEADGLRGAPGPRLGGGDDRRLAGDRGRGEAHLAGAVVVDRRAEDDGMDGIAVGARVRQPLQHHDPDAAPPHRAVGAGVEGAAEPAGRFDASLLVEITRPLRCPQRRAAGERQVALAGEQRLTGEMDRHQRGRAGRLHVDARAAQVELVGDAGGQVVEAVAERRLMCTDGCQQPGVRQQVAQEIAGGADPGVDADRPREPAGIVSRALERLVGALQEEPLLGIDQLGLARRIVEKRGVELLLALDHPTRRNIARVAQQAGVDPLGQQLRGREARDGVTSGAQVLPELLDVAGSREAARHADDRDLLRLQARARRGGRRRWAGVVAGGRRRCRVRASRPVAFGRRRETFQVLGLGAHRGMGEEIEERKRLGEKHFQARLQARQQQRVAAEVEEVVVGSDLFAPKQLSPDAGDGRRVPARAGGGRPAAAFLPGRLGGRGGGARQGAAVDLAVGRQRQPFEQDEACRHHVGRQAAAQGLAQRTQQVGGGCFGLFRPRHHEGDELPAVRRLARQHRRFTDARQGAQPRLDLRRLDAEAADLALQVGAPGEGHFAVGQIASEVAGEIYALSERISQLIALP